MKKITKKTWNSLSKRDQARVLKHFNWEALAGEELPKEFWNAIHQNVTMSKNTIWLFGNIGVQVSLDV